MWAINTYNSDLEITQNSSKSILGVIVSVLTRLSFTFGESRKPTPPTDSLTEFFQHDEVIRL